MEKYYLYPIYKSWRIWLVRETQIPSLLGSNLCRLNFHAGLTAADDFKRTKFLPQVFKAKLKRKSPHKSHQPVFDVENAAEDDWDSLSISEHPWSSNLHCSKKKKKKDFEMHFVVCNYFTVQMIMQCDITFYIIKRDHQFVDKENKICRVKFYLQ